MSDNTGIGWTDATWNPVTGCSHVSPGCEHCYAEALSRRYGRSAKPWTAHNAAENVVLHPDRLDQPLRWKKPRRVFVNSMSDLFHEQVPDEYIDRVFGVMAASPRHAYQVLTKRPERMLAWFNRLGEGGANELSAAHFAVDCRSMEHEKQWNAYAQEAFPVEWPLPNVWLGVSVEDQRRANERIPLLLQTPAAVRFISAEPLLGAVNVEPWIPANKHSTYRAARGALRYAGLPSLNWVIVGGESGPSARICPVEDIVSIARQCQAAGVPTFVKQDAGRYPGKQGRIPDDVWALKEYTS